MRKAIISKQIGNWIVIPRLKKWKINGCHPSTRNAEFTLHQIESNRWRVCGISSAGIRHRIRFYATSLEDAISHAELALGYYTPPTDELSIPAVLGKWHTTLTCKEKTKKDYSNSILPFLDFCESKKLYWWNSLRLEHIQAYYLTIQHYAHDTIRLRLLPIKACARWASINWVGCCHDFARGFVAPKKQTTLFTDNVREALTFNEVAEIINEHWDDYRFIQGIALQAFAGLRVMELMRLTWDNINGDIITIQGEVKNQASVRRIPIPQVVVDILAGCPASTNVITTYRTYDNYGHAVRAILNQHGYDIPPKNLRKTIPTEFKLRGWEGFILERYLGHTPSTITDKHYFSISQEELGQLFRDQVTGRIDEILHKVCQKRHAEGTLDNVLKIR